MSARTPDFPFDPAGSGEGRVALVTGSDSGIGAACAVALAAAGCDVGITWHSDQEGAEATAEEVRALGRRTEVRQADLSDPTSAGPLVDELAEALGGLDVLVNNAGTGTAAPVTDLPLDEWRHVLDVDLTAAFVAAQAAARRMVAQGRGGRIVNVTSVHEHEPRAGLVAYCAAKAGLGAVTKVMAIELGQHGITVNSVGPGEIATPMTGGDQEDARERRRPGVPLGRAGDAREVAAVVAFLASPAASYVTGASWVADGGMLRMGPHGGSHIPGDDWRSPG